MFPLMKHSPSANTCIRYSGGAGIRGYCFRIQSVLELDSLTELLWVQTCFVEFGDPLLPDAGLVGVRAWSKRLIASEDLPLTYLVYSSIWPGPWLTLILLWMASLGARRHSTVGAAKGFSDPK